jgi:hypothetical protein
MNTLREAPCPGAVPDLKKPPKPARRRNCEAFPKWAVWRSSGNAFNLTETRMD